MQNKLFTSDARASEHDGSINVKGNLFCAKTGRKIGYFSRRFVRTNGSWHADHQNFYVTDTAYKGRGIGRAMYRRAMGFYATNGVTKVSLEAVRDGRYVWLKYGFKPERAALPVIHSEMRRVYKKLTGKDMPAGVQLPRHGPKILRFGYRGIPVGKLAVDRTAEFVLTLDLTNVKVRAGLVSRGWLPLWRLLN